MRVFGSFALILVLLSFGSEYTKQDYFLLESKDLTVKGETSVGKFNCKYSLNTKDTLFLASEVGLSDRVPVKEFRCGNFLLNHDFRKTLKERQYPEVYFSLSNIVKDGSNYRYDLAVEIAGVTKTLEGLTLNENPKQLMGEVNLKFSDFDLAPPQKLGGAIKVEEEILLDIKLNLH